MPRIRDDRSKGAASTPAPFGPGANMVERHRDPRHFNLRTLIDGSTAGFAFVTTLRMDIQSSLENRCSRRYELQRAALSIGLRPFDLSTRRRASISFAGWRR